MGDTIPGTCRQGWSHPKKRGGWPPPCLGAAGQMRSPSARSRGFTLVELMITVAIIAVLAVLAGVGYVRFIRTAKTAEPAQMISQIKGAQENFRAESHRYLDVSVGSLDTYFPTDLPKNGKVPWDISSCTTDPCKGFRTLNVRADGQVWYRYATIAGFADGAIKTYDGAAFGTANDPWFIVKATGDTNQDGVNGYYYSSSWINYVWNRNGDE
jgi:type IV pilus assembly protein PilA